MENILRKKNNRQPHLHHHYTHQHHHCRRCHRRNHHTQKSDSWCRRLISSPYNPWYTLIYMFTNEVTYVHKQQYINDGCGARTIRSIFLKESSEYWSGKTDQWRPLCFLLVVAPEQISRRDFRSAHQIAHARVSKNTNMSVVLCYVFFQSLFSRH